jgi:ribose-phosphate pyrophosphokinase
MISSIPQAKEGNSILLFDLHSEGIPYYFEGSLNSKHLYGKDFIHDIIINDLRITDLNKDDYVLASTDAGRAKWIESLGKSFHMNTAFCYKQRSGEQVSLTGINADVKNKNIIIYDDMIRSGNSLISAAKAYKKAGANKIFVITTHGLFVKKIENGDGSITFKKSIEVEQDLFDSLLFDKIFCSNSHPNSQSLKKSIIKDISMFFLS